VTRVLSNNTSVLLASASYAGTIAAVRQLGAKGFSVRVISSERFGAAAWSRYAAHVYSAPSERDSQQFLERLLTIGAADPGQILLPTSDETAWLYSVNAAELGRYFRVAQPPTETLKNILDKKLFGDAAVAAGLAVMPSWEPRNAEEVAGLAPNLHYPILIKPRTHVNRFRTEKGVLVHSADELIVEYRRFVELERHGNASKTLLPNANLPLLQRFARVGKEGVYSLTGFIDRTGELFVTRCAAKVFQRSQPVGIGVCFESRPPVPALSDAVRQLCRKLGYFGIFEIEFLWFEGRWAAIDFNPRLYNQIGMDIRRGMPLPFLACLEAAGETASLRDAVVQAQVDEDTETIFCDRFTLHAILLAQTMTGRISGKDRAYWRGWLRRHETSVVDYAADESDPLPLFIHALSDTYLGLKSLPRFFRSTPHISSKIEVLTEGQCE
jgi:D-aspartate ligase